MIDVGKALEIARVNLVRQARDRTDLLLMVLLPTLMIVALGLQFGGSGRPRLGVVSPADDPAATALVDALAAGDAQLEVRLVGDEATLRSQVEHGELEAGVVIPAGFSAALRGEDTARVRYLATASPLAAGVRAQVEAAVARLGSLVTASRAAAAAGAGTFDQASAAASAAAAAPGVSVEVNWIGEPDLYAGFTQLTLGASTQLVLFMFLTSLMAATRLVATRQLGVSRRMIAGPTSAATIVMGELLGRYAVALLQAAYIVAVSAVVFGVGWGDPLAAGAIVGLFGLVCAAVALLVGAIARNADQAGAIGVFAGLALGALGGCLVPYQIMPPSMQTIARLLPHSWAVLGLQTLSTSAAEGIPGAGLGADLSMVAPNLAVLAGYAVVALALATWRFRRTIAKSPR